MIALSLYRLGFFENLEKPFDVDLDSPDWGRWRASEIFLAQRSREPAPEPEEDIQPFFTLTECVCGRATTHASDSWTPDSLNFPLTWLSHNWLKRADQQQGHSRTLRDTQGTFKGTVRFLLDTFVWFYVKERLWNIEQLDVIALNFILFSYSSIQST